MSVDVTKLPSGLTVITDTMPHLETAALGVWAGVGGRDEKPNEHGISHLLEHMAFKGTARRSSREIVEEIEAVGGDLNAGTSTETTAYYARVMKADVPLALDVLSDILANPSFVPDELEREKNVIVQEIGAAQDTPDDVVFEHLNELCYPDQPMGRSLLGTAKTLKSFDRDTLRGYLATHYRGPDMVVAAAGAVDHRRVVEEVTQRFASFDAAPAPKPQPAMFGTGGSRVVHRELEQAHLTLALEGVPQVDLSLFSLQVFTNTHRRRDVVAAVPGGARKARTVLLDLRVPCALRRHRLLWALHRHRPGRRAGDDGSNRRRHQRCGRNPDRGRGRPRQGPDEGGPADGAGKLQLPGRATGAPCPGLWAAADRGGAGGADRRRQRGIRPATPRVPCCRAAGRPWSRLAAAGVWTRRWLLRKD